MRSTLRYGAEENDDTRTLIEMLMAAGHPTTPGRGFDWHVYTRVLQFQVRCVKQFSGWTISDVDGIVGPKTWEALEALQPPGADEPVPDSGNPAGIAVVNLHKASPNQSERGASITHIVLHNTAGSFDSSVSWLCDRLSEASAHLVISRGGYVAQLVSFSKKAWHAGNARMNANSIGIELEATVNQQGLTGTQELMVVAWCKKLMKDYDIPAKNIGIHRWYRNTSCPGLIWKTDEAFLAWRKQHFGE